ncbi:hypothetical protein EBR96_04370 [bacterium]|nr:hypothetical protein [bacterium]
MIDFQVNLGSQLATIADIIGRVPDLFGHVPVLPGNSDIMSLLQALRQDEWRGVQDAADFVSRTRGMRCCQSGTNDVLFDLTDTSNMYLVFYEREFRLSVTAPKPIAKVILARLVSFGVQDAEVILRDLLVNRWPKTYTEALIQMAVASENASKELHWNINLPETTDIVSLLFDENIEAGKTLPRGELTELKLILPKMLGNTWEKCACLGKYLRSQADAIGAARKEESYEGQEEP